MAFFKEHVIGKALVTPKFPFKWDNDKMEGEYEDQTTYNNFAETAEGFAFDLTVVTKETLYDLDKEGKRVGPPHDFSGVLVFHYEIGECASTKKLTGTGHGVVSTVKGPLQFGTAVLVTAMKVEDGKLTWTETQSGYADFVAAKGKYKPGAYDGKYTFKLVDGKLEIASDQTNYDVDPDTLKRTPASEKLPTAVTREIDQK